MLRTLLSRSALFVLGALAGVSLARNLPPMRSQSMWAALLLLAVVLLHAFRAGRASATAIATATATADASASAVAAGGTATSAVQVVIVPAGADAAALAHVLGTAAYTVEAPADVVTDVRRASDDEHALISSVRP